MNKLYRILVRNGKDSWFIKRMYDVLVYDKFKFTYFNSNEVEKIIDMVNRNNMECELIPYE